MNGIAEILCSLRGEMSLREVENVTSVSRSYLSRVENGLRKPSAEVLSKLADCYGVDPLFLYGAAGLLKDAPEEKTLSDLAAVVNAGGRLSSEQVKLLRLVAESMLSDAEGKDPSRL